MYLYQVVNIEGTVNVNLNWIGTLSICTVYFTKYSIQYKIRAQFGAIAQLGERNTGSVEVSGSIPLSSTKFTGQ